MSMGWLLAVLRGVFCATNLPFGITHRTNVKIPTLVPGLALVDIEPDVNAFAAPLYFRNQLSSNFTSSVLVSFSFFTSGPSSLYSKNCRLGGFAGPPATYKRGCKRP